MKKLILGVALGTSMYLSSVAAETTLTLTQEQKEGLVYMYQEEKVARDVYGALGDLWQERIFDNIQKSEQRHMDAVKSLLEKYDIPVPVIDDTPGVFENEELQALYEELLEEGKTSRQSALEVGVLVEETDIGDLEARIVDAPDDITKVYNSLLRGSNNHLRAFTRVLERTQDKDDTTNAKKEKTSSKKSKKSKKRRTSKKKRAK